MRVVVVTSMLLASLTMPMCAYASLGDRSQDFVMCRETCAKANCRPEQNAGLALHLKLLGIYLVTVMIHDFCQR